jgi:flagellar hook assembly protein FlgD
VSYDTEIRDENYDITVAATDVNGQTASFVLRVAGGRTLRIEDVANHPNPFTRDTRIIYKLNQQGTDVVIRIYTVGGRLIHAFDDAPNDLSYNEFLWDGTDSEGDRVANGVYLYTIDVTGEDGASVSAGVGRMVKVK